MGTGLICGRIIATVSTEAIANGLTVLRLMVTDSRSLEVELLVLLEIDPQPVVLTVQDLWVLVLAPGSTEVQARACGLNCTKTGFWFMVSGLQNHGYWSY